MTRTAVAQFFGRKLDAFRESLNESAAEIRHIKEKRIYVAVCAGLLLAALITGYLTIGKQLLLFINDRDLFKAWLNGFGVWEQLVFVAIRAAQTVVKIIPAEPLEIGAGYAFGTWGGLLYCSLGSLLGSVIILALTKRFGMKIVRLFIPQRKIDSLAFLQNKKNLNLTLFILYLIPSTPKDVITYLIGLTDENIFLFLALTTVGRIPSIVTSTWCGSTLENENYLAAAVIFIATAVLGCTGAFVYGRLSKRKTEKISG